MNEIKGRGSLRRRFPGIDTVIGRGVADMANHYVGPAVRGWIEVKPKDAIPGQWIGYLNVRTPDGQEFRLPLIPDEHNPEPTKLVRPEDTPWVYTYMDECERDANKYLGQLLAYVLHQWQGGV